MLPSSERSLIARDTALPGLGLLLDADAFAAALEAATASGVLGATLTYLRYKPGTNCLASYECRLAGQTVTVHAVAYRDGAAKTAKRLQRQRATTEALGTSTVIVPEAGVVAHVWPEDPALHALSRLGDPGRLERLVHRIVPDARARWGGTGELSRLTYKPQRRFAGKLSVAGTPVAVLKCYTASDFPRALTGAGLTAGDGLTTAPLLGALERRAIIAHGWMPGERLSERLANPSLDARELQRVGAAIAALHRVAPRPGLREASSSTLSHAAMTLAETAAFLLPTEGRRVRALAARVTRALLSATATAVVIHGDCYAKQFLWTPSHVTLIDFDEAALGPPQLDLGLFLAHVERDAQRGLLSDTRAAELGEHLLAGYTAAAAPLEIAAYVAAGILTLLHHPFRHREANWDEQVTELLDRAQVWCERAERAARPMVAA